MIFRGFQSRLILLFVAVLALLQLTTLIAVRLAGERRLDDEVPRQLSQANEVFDERLQSQRRELGNFVRVLASEFAFREALALGDQPTIESALANHQGRVSADAAYLLELDGSVTASTVDSPGSTTSFPFPELLNGASGEPGTSALVTFEGSPHQVVVVPVLAPNPIYYVASLFAVDDEVLSVVPLQTSWDATIWSGDLTSATKTASSIPPDELPTLLDRVSAVPYGEIVDLQETPFLAMRRLLDTGDGSEISLLLVRSITDVRSSQRQLEWSIFLLSMLALAFALLAAVAVARGVSRPLLELSHAAGRIERGDYARPIEVSGGEEIRRLTTAFNSMKEGIASREQQIRFQATHDELTRLPNRAHLLDQLASHIANARRLDRVAIMIMLDINRFKEINDTLGHQTGDLLLREIGGRLENLLGEDHTVARLGGDEFAVAFVGDASDEWDVVPRRIQQAFDEPFELEGAMVEVTASQGVAIFPKDGDDEETIMMRADIAMYQAKRNHEPFVLYHPGQDQHSLRRLAMVSQLRTAIAGDELQLFYQPKMRIADRSIVGVEALVRWQHPVHGMLPPGEFIPIAEQSGNISAITRWVLARAIRDIASLSERVSLPKGVAVNLSALDFFDDNLVGLISHHLEEHGLPPALLTLEITESAIMQDPPRSIRTLERLAELGVVLAIDDYGTGYSSLSNLTRLPAHELKIDRSFVMHLSDGPSQDHVVVRSTVDLGHAMGMEVVAEGVEDEEIIEVLASFGCDLAQGYAIARPIPLAELLPYLERPKATAQ
ncbi:MAG: EAL domain-containing protein [Acidobacteria bacterium]|nr:EAL domain-containing protein [Acidobacteriota bacterium]